MTVLLASIVDATIVIALSFAAAAALKRRSAAVRHAVLAAAIVAAALSPALELLVPQLPVVQWNDAAPAVSSGMTLTSGEVPSGSGAMTATVPAVPAIPWTTLLFAVWLLGAMVTLAGLLTGLVRLARLTARCTPVKTGRWREMADELSRVYKLRRPVAILLSTDPSPLVTCGVFEPKIILPAGAATWTDDRRRVVLAHEMAHVRRCDGAMQLAGEVLRVIHWFNPLVWLSCRRLRQESEYACDDAVLRGGIDATDYASHLLDVARQAVGRHHAWTSAPAIAHPSTLERRISAMLNRQRNREPLTRRAWAGAALAAVAVIVPLAAAGVAPPSDSSAVILANGGDVMLTPAPVTPVPARAPATRRPVPATDIAAAAAAPQAPAAISGTMRDQTGGVLPGVRLTLDDTGSGVRYTTFTDANGQFAFRALQPAQYELVASLPGFATVTDVVPLVAGAAVARAITLPVGTVAETITVGCSVTSVATAAPPARLSVTMQMPQSADVVLPTRLRQVWNRALGAIFPGTLRTTAEGRGAVAGPGASRRKRPSAQETHERQAYVPGDSDPGPGHDRQARWPPWCGRLHERVEADRGRARRRTSSGVHRVGARCRTPVDVHADAPQWSAGGSEHYGSGRLFPFSASDAAQSEMTGLNTR